MEGHRIEKPKDFDRYSGSKMQKFRFSVDCLGCREKIVFAYEYAEKEGKVICPVCDKANPIEFF